MRQESSPSANVPSSAPFRPPAFLLKLRRTGAAVVVEVHGELDHLHAHRLVQATSDSLADADADAVILDLRRCEFLDSTGISALVEVAASLPRGRVALAAMSDPVRRLLDRIDLGDAARSYSSIDSALAELERQVAR